MDFISREKQAYSQVFNRLPVCITRGKGGLLYDSQGREYLDMFGGIAVCSVGHCHPRVTDAITRQAGKLVHASNWVYTEPQLDLAEKIRVLTGLDKVFFTNSGTESVEAAIKLARKQTGRKSIISCQKSFHGRTMGALALTWKSEYRAPFEPVMPGAKFIEYNNPESLKEAVAADTAAFIVEPVQGEAGVIIPDPDYLKAAKDITGDNGSLLIVDEVQTGFGRTGEWFGYSTSGIQPDILCLAKGMGGGFPIGAMVSAEGVDFAKGNHGGTYPGSPLACTAALEVIKVIEDEGLVENSRQMGVMLREKLSALGLENRGLGLMNAFKADGRDTVEALLDKGVLTINSGDYVRILPALNITEKNITYFTERLEEVLEKIK